MKETACNCAVTSVIPSLDIENSKKDQQVRGHFIAHLICSMEKLNVLMQSSKHVVAQYLVALFFEYKFRI